MIMGKRYRQPVCEVVIRPAGSGTETRFVLLAALVTALVCGGAVLLRNVAATAKEAPSWQVDAFKELSPEELGVFNALYTAAPEIEMIHEEMGGWPTADALAAEYIPPFVEDAAWEKNGAMGWFRVAMASPGKHIVLYVGRPQKESGIGTFMLVMLHDHVKKEGNAGGSTHAPFEIWLHASPAVDVPNLITDQALISRGWREVVARKGEQETRNSKGDFVQ